MPVSMRTTTEEEFNAEIGTVSGVASQGSEDLAAPSGRTIERLRILWSAREFLKRTIGIGLLGSVLLAIVLPPKYESTIRIMPPEPDALSGMGMISSMLGGGSGG